MSEDLTAHETDQLNEGRLIRAASDVLIPFIHRKREEVIGRLITQFKSGNTEMLLPAVAELSVLSDMNANLSQKVKKAEHLERKVYGDTTR